jgi:hypothetical protein
MSTSPSTTAGTPAWHWEFSPITKRRIALISADGKNDILLATGNDTAAWAEVSDEHAELIASAPALHAENRELREEVKRLRGEMTAIASICEDMATDGERQRELKRKGILAIAIGNRAALTKPAPVGDAGGEET